jgi:cytochrome c-type biogenesis protein
MRRFIGGLLVPAAMQRERRFQVLPDSLGTFAPPLMGMTFAFGWTPCIGPILSVVLSTAATQATLAKGVGLLVAYSLGLGVPFVAAGLGLAKLTRLFGWVKRHFRAMNLASGAFLVVFGLLLLTSKLGPLAGEMQQLMRSLGLGRLANI